MRLRVASVLAGLVLLVAMLPGSVAAQAAGSPPPCGGSATVSQAVYGGAGCGLAGLPLRPGEIAAAGVVTGSRSLNLACLIAKHLDRHHGAPKVEAGKANRDARAAPNERDQGAKGRRPFKCLPGAAVLDGGRVILIGHQVVSLHAGDVVIAWGPWGVRDQHLIILVRGLALVGNLGQSKQVATPGQQPGSLQQNAQQGEDNAASSAASGSSGTSASSTSSDT